MNEFNKTELLEKTTEYMNYIAQHKENMKKLLKNLNMF